MSLARHHQWIVDLETGEILLVVTPEMDRELQWRAANRRRMEQAGLNSYADEAEGGDLLAPT